jgi:hypothetical protein
MKRTALTIRPLSTLTGGAYGLVEATLRLPDGRTFQATAHGNRAAVALVYRRRSAADREGRR